MSSWLLGVTKFINSLKSNSSDVCLEKLSYLTLVRKIKQKLSSFPSAAKLTCISRIIDQMKLSRVYEFSCASLSFLKKSIWARKSNTL